MDVNDIKRSRYGLQVSVNVISTLMRKAHVECGSAVSVLDRLDETAKHSKMLLLEDDSKF